MSKPYPFYATCTASFAWSLYYAGPYAPQISIGTYAIFLSGAIAIGIMAVIEARIVRRWQRNGNDPHVDPPAETPDAQP